MGVTTYLHTNLNVDWTNPCSKKGSNVVTWLEIVWTGWKQRGVCVVKPCHCVSESLYRYQYNTYTQVRPYFYWMRIYVNGFQGRVWHKLKIITRNIPGWLTVFGNRLPHVRWSTLGWCFKRLLMCNFYLVEIIFLLIFLHYPIFA